MGLMQPKILKPSLSIDGPMVMPMNAVFIASLIRIMMTVMMKDTFMCRVANPVAI